MPQLKVEIDDDTAALVQAAMRFGVSLDHPIKEFLLDYLGEFFRNTADQLAAELVAEEEDEECHEF
jgi:hypothetical protein